MITKTDFKAYAKIPYAYDDDVIDKMIAVAYSYLRTACDDFTKKYNGTAPYNTSSHDSTDYASKADFVATCIVEELYDNREQFNGEVKPSYLMRSLLMQLESFPTIEEENNA